MALRPVLRDALTDPAANALGRFLPSQLPGLKLWTRYNQGITITGAGVSQWDDQSGNDNHLLQATDANRPSKEADGSILFDGVNDFLKAVGFTWVQPETVYLRMKQVTWTDTRTLFDGNAANSGRVGQVTVTPTISMRSGGVPVADNTDLVVDVYAAMAVIFNGASSLLQINNNTPTTGSPGGANMSGFTLGAHGANGVFSNIQVKEVIGYSTAHDAVTRAKVIAYLQTL